MVIGQSDRGLSHSTDALLGNGGHENLARTELSNLCRAGRTAAVTADANAIAAHGGGAPPPMTQIWLPNTTVPATLTAAGISARGPGVVNQVVGVGLRPHAEGAVAPLE